jgi:hypothetical protein
MFGNELINGYLHVNSTPGFPSTPDPLLQNHLPIKARDSSQLQEGGCAIAPTKFVDKQPFGQSLRILVAHL